MADEKVKIIISGDSKDAEAAFKRASDKAKELGNVFESCKGKAMDFIKGLVGFEMLKKAANWTKELAAGFLSAADITEQYRTRLTVLLRSQEEGNRLFQEMADYAGRVPFEFEEVMGSATQLSGVMKGGVNEIKQWMPLIGDLAAASGLGIQQTTEQVVRMYSAGAASADLFRERGVLAMLGFKAGVSYTAEETRKMMFESWQKADSQFRSATDKLAITWTGVMSMLKDAWFKFRTTVMESGAFDSLKDTAKDIKDWLDKAFESGKAKEWARAISSTISIAIDIIKEFGKAVIFAVKHIDDLLVALSAAAIMRASTAIGALSLSFTGLGATIATVSTALKGFLPVLAAVAGYEIGKAIDYWTYKLTKIDLSGMNRLKEVQEWISENQEYLNKRSEKYKKILEERKKAEIEAAAVTEVSAEAIKKIEDATASFSSKIEELNPDLAETTKSIMNLWKEADKLFKEIDKNLTGDIAKEFKAKIQIEFDKGVLLIQEKQYREELKKTFDFAKENALNVLEEEKKSIEGRIDYLQDYRSVLLQTYDDALAKAQQYYQTAAQLDEMIAHGKQFLGGLNAKPASIWEQMEKDKKVIFEMVRGEGINIFDTTNTLKTMETIEEFFGKYKGMQDVLGFEVDFSGLKHEYEDLINKLEITKQSTEQAGDAWTEFANQQAYAIQTVDQWLQYLQSRIYEMDVQINQVREIQVDTSSAITNIQNLISWINYLNTLTAQSQASSAGVQVPRVHSGTDYVPKTGLYLLEKGEKVMPKSDNRNYSKNITFASTINIQGGKDGKETAKEIDQELANLWRYNRSELKRAMV